MKLRRNPGTFTDAQGHSHPGEKPHGDRRRLFVEYMANPVNLINIALGVGHRDGGSSYYIGKFLNYTTPAGDGVTLTLSDRQLTYRAGRPAVLDFLCECYRTRINPDATDDEAVAWYLAQVEIVDSVEHMIEDHATERKSDAS